jgi:uncharacterized protein (TIGR01777 family)
MTINSNSKIIIAGGSGFIGMSLAHHLSALGADVIILSRHSPVAGKWRHAKWDARSLGDWTRELENASGLVNLVGRSVDCIKTPDHCDEILRSRVEATRILGEACRAIANPPPVWVQMSTAHIYGDPPSIVCDESSPFGYGLAPMVGKAWEKAFNQSVLPNQRGVILRTSFVIGCPNPSGKGALGKLGALAKLGLGGRVGSGNQGMSWIHVTDFISIMQRAMTDDSMKGAYIVSSPDPLCQTEFMRLLRRYAGGLGSLGFGPPAFEWMVRIGASWILRTDPDLALYGRYVLPKRLLDEGFKFKFPSLDAALAQIYRDYPSTDSINSPL